MDPCPDDVEMPLQPAPAEPEVPLFPEYSPAEHGKAIAAAQTLPAYPVSPNNPNGTYGLRRNVTLVQERHEEQVSRFPSAPGALVTSVAPAVIAKVASLPAGGAQQQLGVQEVGRNVSAPAAAFTDYAGLTARLQAGATDVQPVVRRPEGMTIKASDRSNSGLITLEEETSWSRSRNNPNA